MSVTEHCHVPGRGSQHDSRQGFFVCAVNSIGTPRLADCRNSLHARLPVSDASVMGFRKLLFTNIICEVGAWVARVQATGGIRYPPLRNGEFRL